MYRTSDLKPCSRSRSAHWAGSATPAAGWRAAPPTTIAHPSLSIADGAEGRILLTCFAGCSWAAIRDALQARSLWPSRSDATCPASRLGAAPCHSELPKLDHGLAVREAHLARGDSGARHGRRDLSAEPVPHRHPCRRPCATPRCGIGRAVSRCPAWSPPSRRQTAASAVCIAPSCGRTAAARRTCDPAKKMLGSVSWRRRPARRCRTTACPLRRHRDRPEHPTSLP